PGQPFDNEIVDAIEESRAMRLIFSEHCNESEYIRREVTVAGENRKVIIPFRIEDAQPRRGLRVRLSDLHWIDGFAAHERAIDELARRFAPSAMEEERGSATNAPPTTLPDGAGPGSPTPAARPPQPAGATLAAKNHRAAIGAAGVLAVVGIAAAMWFWSGGFGAKPTQAPAASIAADALSKGKAAFDRKDYVEAMRWDRQAADQGNTTAQTYVGYLYENGLGVAQDYGEALRWYRMAANQGNIDAEYNLALLYADGRGVPRDLGQARQWMQKAADAGDPEAKKWLGNHGG